MNKYSAISEIEKISDSQNELEQEEKQLIIRKNVLEDKLVLIENDTEIYTLLIEKRKCLDERVEVLSNRRVQIMRSIEDAYNCLLEEEKKFLEDKSRLDELLEAGIVELHLEQYVKDKETELYNAFAHISEITQQYGQFLNLGKALVSQNITKMRLPNRNGTWEGLQGNSKWIPEMEMIPLKNNPHKQTCREILLKYDIDGILYKDGEPDFSVIEDRVIGHIELMAFPYRRTGKLGTYEMASIEAARKLTATEGITWTPKMVESYMRMHELSWHECADLMTVRAVPTIINSLFEHCGGISIKKGINAIAKVINSHTGIKRGISLQKNIVESFIVSKAEIGNNVQLRRKEFQTAKKTGSYH